MFFLIAQDIDVASIEPIQSFLSLYIYITIYWKKKDVNDESGWGDMVVRLQAFFVAHTGIQIHALHEM